MNDGGASGGAATPGPASQLQLHSLQARPLPNHPHPVLTHRSTRSTDEEVGPCGEPAPEESPFQTGTTSDVEGELTEEDLGAAVDGALEEGEAPLEGEGAIEEEPLTDGEATA